MARTNQFKHHERTVAKRLGGQRVGQYGGSDVKTERFAIECKSRKSLPAWLHAVMEQAERHAEDEQLSLVILHEAGKRYDSDFVVMKLSVFKEII